MMTETIKVKRSICRVLTVAAVVCAVLPCVYMMPVLNDNAMTAMQARVDTNIKIQKTVMKRMRTSNVQVVGVIYKGREKSAGKFIFTTTIEMILKPCSKKETEKKNNKGWVTDLFRMIYKANTDRINLEITMQHDKVENNIPSWRKTAYNTKNTDESTPGNMHVILKEATELLCGRAFSNESPCFDIIFDYAILYYCNMPAVIEEIKNKMEDKFMHIVYKVLYTIVYNKETNEIEEGYTNSRRVYNPEYNVLKYKDSVSACEYLYTYENDGYTENEVTDKTDVQCVALTRMAVKETGRNMLVHQHEVYDSIENKMVHYRVQYWALAQIFSMIHCEEEENLDHVTLDISYTQSNTDIETYISSAVLNVSTPKNIDIGIYKVETSTNMNQCIMLQTDSRMRKGAASIAELEDMLHGTETDIEAHEKECMNTRCEWRIPGQAYIRQIITFGRVLVQNRIAGKSKHNVVSFVKYKCSFIDLCSKNPLYNDTLTSVFAGMHYRYGTIVQLDSIQEYVEYVKEREDIVDERQIANEVKKIYSKREKIVRVLMNTEQADNYTLPEQCTTTSKEHIPKKQKLIVEAQESK